MKILLTTDWYKPTINGVVTSVDNLCSGLTALGHEVRIATLSGLVHSMREGNVSYYGSVGMGIIYPEARLQIPWNKKMTDELKEWGPDIVHSQCEFSTFFLARKIAHDLTIPLVHTYHTIYADYTHYFFRNKALGEKSAVRFTEITLNQADRVIVPSEKIRTVLSGYQICTPIELIPSGIELEKFTGPAAADRQRIRPQYGIPEDEFLLLPVGRLAQKKNLDEILHLLKKMPDRTQRLMIVGDGPHRKNLEALAAKLGLSDQLIFTGRIEPDEIAAFYHAGDVFVNASNSETQGLTYIEAMASGLPLLCRRDPCLDGVIEHGKSGFLYEKDNEFTETADLLKHNRKLREEIGKAARQKAVENYSISSFANSCGRLYEYCIREKGRKKRTASAG